MMRFDRWGDSLRHGFRVVIATIVILVILLGTIIAVLN
jgi:hypothetical protein